MPIDLAMCPEAFPREALAYMEKAVAAALEMENAPASAVMAMRVTGEEEIRQINRDMRGVDRATDVLSFPSRNYPPHTSYSHLKNPRLPREDGAYVLGDAVISLPHALRQGEEFGHGVIRELTYLTAHSALHLLGYDHIEDCDRPVMREKEKEIMAKVGLYRDEELLEMAASAMARSYSPYSHYPVGACILGRNGKTYVGANIENASYGASLCAERCAVCQAVTDGCTRFAAIAVASENGAFPCGICRQVLSEFSDDMTVIVGTKEGIAQVVKLTGLLPGAFGPRDLEETK